MRVTFIGVFPTVATTRVLVSLLSAITSVAAAVAKNETTLTIKRTHFFGFGCKPVHPNSSFSSFCKPMLTEDKRETGIEGMNGVMMMADQHKAGHIYRLREENGWPNPFVESSKPHLVCH